MWGKMLGGAFGFVVGGPLGALLGAAFGHNLDRGGQKATEEPDPVGDERARGAFLATAFQLMGHIAKADGRVSELEIAAARAMMDHLQLTAAQRRAAIDCFTEGKQPGFAADATIDAFRNACRGRPILAQRLLNLLFNIAYADGGPSPATQTRLAAVAERLGIVRLQFEALHTLFRAQRWAQQQSHQTGSNQSHDQRTHSQRPATAVNSLAQAYAVLGLNKDAGPDDIKLAYRRLLKRHHPDKLAAKGVSAAELARATEKTRELTAAYERIREARGF
ncbi:MAG: co-chaperone DjlA [Candidatus Contendobacter sp.]|nr:co-chaperone DjlA [Candidatus Contendobacter sp.]